MVQGIPRELRLMVIGASGFLGRNLLLGIPRNWQVLALYNSDGTFWEFLRKNDLNNVTAIRQDLTTLESSDTEFSSAIAGYPYCIYFAGRVDLPGSIRDVSGDNAHNVQALINFLSHYRGKRLVYVSSGAVYEGNSGLVGPHTVLKPTLPYAISKAASERYVESFCNRVGHFEEFVNVRFYGAYGPHEAARKIYSRLVTALGIHRQPVVRIAGDGKNLISAMYVDDAIAGFLSMLTSSARNLTVDFTGKSVSILELVETASEVFGIEASIVADGWPAEYITFYSSQEQMKELFGVTPSIGLDVGLRALHEWIATTGRLGVNSHET